MALDDLRWFIRLQSDWVRNSEQCYLGLWGPSITISCKLHTILAIELSYSHLLVINKHWTVLLPFFIRSGIVWSNLFDFITWKIIYLHWKIFGTIRARQTEKFHSLKQSQPQSSDSIGEKSFKRDQDHETHIEDDVIVKFT